MIKVAQKANSFFFHHLAKMLGFTGLKGATLRWTSICFFIFSTFFTTLAIAKALFSGDPAIDKVNPNIFHSIIFKYAPNPHAKVFDYASYEVPSDEHYSRYRITRIVRKGHLSRYKTVEVPPDAISPEVKGKGVSYGGMFSLMYEKQQTKHDYRPKWEDFYKRYEVTSITNIRGHLFPLKVGNELIFNYTAAKRNFRGNFLNSGEMMYRVVRKYKNYPYSKKPVPGDIYVVQLWRSTRQDPKLEIINEYDFSKRLGWYINAKYFRQGRSVVDYHLTNWS